MAAATLTALCVGARRLPAWNATGHRLAALVAWRLMQPAARERVVSQLRRHPRFQRDFLGRMPQAIRNAPQETRNKWIFAQASIWPDIARGYPRPLHRKYHRGPWHYINEPLFLSEADRDFFGDDVPANLSTTWRTGMWTRGLNVIQALKRCTALLRRPGTAPAERAVLLCWVLHLAGDLHQPLHAASLFSRQRFPGGDRGGNDIPVSDNRNLHSFWDGAAGHDISLSALDRTARAWLDQAPLRNAARAAAGSLRFETWRDESYDAAWEHAYSGAILAEVARGETTPRRKLRPFAPGVAYGRNAAAVSAERIVRAGARLARLLE